MSAAITLAEQLEKVKPVTLGTSYENSPSGVILQLLKLMLKQVDLNKISPLFSSRVQYYFTWAKGINEWKAQLNIVRNSMNASSMPIDVAIDFVTSQVKFAVEGSDTVGWRVRMTPAGSSASTLAIYVIKEGQQYRILTSPGNFEPIGKLVLELYSQENKTAARQWLDWVREELTISSEDDPLGGSRFARFWKIGENNPDENMEPAAVLLVAFNSDFPNQAKHYIEIMKKAINDQKNESMKIILETALTFGYITSRNDEQANEFAKSLYERYPDSVTALFSLMMSCRHLHKLADAEKLARDFLKRIPNNTFAIKLLAEILLDRDRLDEVIQLNQKVLDSGRGANGLNNDIAWYSLFKDQVSPDAISYAQKALNNSNDKNFLHTAACVMADAGRLTEAKNLFIKYLDASENDENDSCVWLVYGRMAQRIRNKGTGKRKLCQSETK